MRLWSYVGACLLVAAAFVFRMALDPLLGDRSPYLLFTFAVLVAGARYGLLPGLLATVASTVAGLWAFLPPRYALGPLTPDEWTNIAAFIVTCLAMLVFTHQLVRSRRAEALSVKERRSASGRLHESQQRLAGIVDSAMDAIITINKAQEIVLFNPAAEQMFGYPAASIIGQQMTRLLPERSRAGHGQHVQRFREEGITSRRMNSLGAISGLRSSGEEFPIEASISHIIVGGEHLSTVILRDITERKLSEEAQLLLAREVDHRAKNALAVAQALITLTRAETVQEFAATITGRIASLARAHSLLSRSRWTGAALRQVVQDEVSAYSTAGQVQVTGPEVMLATDAVQPLSLVFHELATNALKHGALSAERGMVQITWSAQEDGLELKWAETGGPPVAEPDRLGFGSKLLRQTVDRQLQGKLEKRWDAQGLSATILLPPSMFTTDQHSQSRKLAAEAPQIAILDGQYGRVLVVEDEELVAMELCGELERIGWHVCGPAATVAEAEAVLQDCSAVDAAVLDVNLRGRPVYPLAEILRERQIPFLFCSGYEIVDPQGRFQAVPVVRKPAQSGAVAAALQRLVKARSSASALAERRN